MFFVAYIAKMYFLDLPSRLILDPLDLTERPLDIINYMHNLDDIYMHIWHKCILAVFGKCIVKAACCTSILVHYYVSKCNGIGILYSIPI